MAVTKCGLSADGAIHPLSDGRLDTSISQGQEGNSAISPNVNYRLPTSYNYETSTYGNKLRYGQIHKKKKKPDLPRFVLVNKLFRNALPNDEVMILERGVMVCLTLLITVVATCTNGLIN